MALKSELSFNPQGRTVVVTADVVAPSGTQCPVYERFDDAAAGEYRIFNSSANAVHLGVGPTAAAAQANAVAATAGNPAAGVPIKAGETFIMRFQIGAYFSCVATGASTVYITPGTGM